MKRAFHPVARNLKRHFGVTAKHVAVRSHRLWYWQVLSVIAYVALGYLIAYWHLTGGEFGVIASNLHTITQQNQQLQAKFVQNERQLQVAEAAQHTLAKELASMQDESIRLKEDVAFYKNILNEEGAEALKLHSFKVNRTVKPGVYEYHILLVQSGRHDKIVKGSLKLQLDIDDAVNPSKLPLMDGDKAVTPIVINFKYYQRIDGTFVLPSDAKAHAVELMFMEAGINQPKITSKVDIPV